MRAKSIIDQIAQIEKAVVFNEAAHSYTVNGRIVPSVTTVLPHKDFFVTEERLEECRQEGKWNHKLLEDYFIDDEPTDTPFNISLAHFLRQHTEFGEYVGSEVVLWSKYGYAGTADLLFTNAVVDLKRTITDKRLHALQLAGYHTAAVEHGLIQKNRNHYIITIDDAGSLTQKNVWNDMSELMFLACVKKYKAETRGDAEEIAKLERTLQLYLKVA